MKENIPAMMYLVRRAHRYGYDTLNFYKAIERISEQLQSGEIPSYAHVM